MKREIVPIADLDKRIPRAGKIKLGIKTAKAMKALHEWRFLSPYRDALDALAIQYGGQVVPYHDDKANPPDQLELVSHASEIHVYLLPSGIDTSYEAWSGGGCVRRCDGVTVEVPVKVGNSDYDLVEKPCLCMAEGERSCDPKTRLTVILPGVAFRGGWLLETKSWNAALELPGMHDLLGMLSAGGMIQAKLTIEQRTKQTINGKRNFVVPVLSVSQTALELQAGMGAVTAIANPVRGALGVATPAAIGSGAPAVDVYDAEVIDDDLLDLEAQLREAGKFYQLDPEAFLTAMTRSVGGDRKRLRNALARMKDDSIAPVGIENGRVKWRT